MEFPVYFLVEVPEEATARQLQEIAEAVARAGGRLRWIRVRELDPDEEELILEEVGSQ